MSTATRTDLTEEQLADIARPLTDAIIEELCVLRADARQSAENFTLAIAEQAEHHGISKGALRRFVCAKEADKLDGLDSEATDLATLLEMSA